MAVLPKAIYRFNGTPIKLSVTFFSELKQRILKFVWKYMGELPCGSDSKSVCLQCQRPRFNTWVRKMPWRRKWQPNLVLLPGKFHGWRNLIGYSPWDCKESDTTSLSLSWKYKRFWIIKVTFFWNLSPRVRETKAKINKWDLIKLRNFCTVMETIYKVKDSLQNGRKYLQMLWPTDIHF